MTPEYVTNTLACGCTVTEYPDDDAWELCEDHWERQWDEMYEYDN